MKIAERLESIADYLEGLNAMEDAEVLRKAIAHIRKQESEIVLLRRKILDMDEELKAWEATQ